MVSLCVNEDHTDIEDHDNRVDYYGNDLCQFGPVFLHSVQRMQRVGQHSVRLVPLHKQDCGNRANQEIDDICGDAVPDPLLLAVLVADHAPKIRDYSHRLDEGEAGHDAHTVEVLVDFELHDDHDVRRREQDQDRAEGQLGRHAAGEFFVGRVDWGSRGRRCIFIR